MSTRTLHPAFIVTESLKARFFAKTIKSDSGCIIWTGAVQRHGYGAFKIGPEKIDAHVASWRIANGGIPVPLSKLIMHSCDCRMCVNPEHLSVGTVSQNMLQAHTDGRGNDFKSQGESHYRAQITESDVRHIRSLHAAGGTTGRKIAADLNLSYWIVKGILSGRSWKHVTDEVQP